MDKIGIYINGKLIGESVPVTIEEAEIGSMSFLFLEGEIAYFKLFDGKAAFQIPPEHLEIFSKMKEGDRLKYKKS